MVANFNASFGHLTVAVTLERVIYGFFIDFLSGL